MLCSAFYIFSIFDDKFRSRYIPEYCHTLNIKENDRIATAFQNLPLVIELLLYSRKKQNISGNLPFSQSFSALKKIGCTCVQPEKLRLSLIFSRPCALTQSFFLSAAQICAHFKILESFQSRPLSNY